MMIDLFAIRKSLLAKKAYSNSYIAKAGFTLIELSIVLVIIGLLIGGVLTGQDLIAAAEIRSQISQIEKYTTATNTFRIKYNALPGDIVATEATAFGFTAIPNRVGTIAQGNGNGIIEGMFAGFPTNSGYDPNITPVDYNMQINGETAWFWADLSNNSHLIDGNFTSASATPAATSSSGYAGSDVAKILPIANLKKRNYISVYQRHRNIYFIISVIDAIYNHGGIVNSPALTITPQQAYSIDSKMDDGLPQSGKVNATYINPAIDMRRLVWAAAIGSGEGETSTSATPASSTTCYDNGNVGGATQKYSVGTNSGNGLNCALSFKF